MMAATRQLTKAAPLVSALSLLSLLAACGGGGGSGGVVNPRPPATETLSLSAPVFKTLAGGKSISLGATTATGGAAAWTLAAGNPGSLSAASGASVNYVPPAGVAAPTAVTVSATIAGLSKSVTLYVYPDPGAPALRLVAGVGSGSNPQPLDGTGAGARFENPRVMGAAPDGSLYVADFMLSGTLTEDRFALRKITPAGAVTTLSSNIDLSPNYYNDVSRIAADRAGVVYAAEFGRSSIGNLNPAGGAIYKLGADGKLALFAGAASHNAASGEVLQQDGTGTEARFYAPDIVGFDLDNNMYVKDSPRNVTLARPYRKVTPQGVVTTIDSLPVGVGAADDGNSDVYAADIAQHVIYRTPAGGVKSVVAGVEGRIGDQLGALPGVLSAPNGLVAVSPYSYAFFSGTRVLKLVAPR